MARSVSPARQCFPASKNSSAIVQALGDTLAATKLRDAEFAPQAIQQDPGLLFSRVLFPGCPANASDDLFGKGFDLIFTPASLR